MCQCEKCTNEICGFIIGSLAYYQTLITKKEEKRQCAKLGCFLERSFLPDLSNQ